MFIQPKTFEYTNSKEELEILAKVLDLLMYNKTTEAMKILITRQEVLIKAQIPKLVDYVQNA